MPSEVKEMDQEACRGLKEGLIRWKGFRGGIKRLVGVQRRYQEAGGGLEVIPGGCWWFGGDIRRLAYDQKRE